MNIDIYMKALEEFSKTAKKASTTEALAKIDLCNFLASNSNFSISEEKGDIYFRNIKKPLAYIMQEFEKHPDKSTYINRAHKLLDPGINHINKKAKNKYYAKDIDNKYEFFSWVDKDLWECTVVNKFTDDIVYDHKENLTKRELKDCDAIDVYPEYFAISLYLIDNIL